MTGSIQSVTAILGMNIKDTMILLQIVLVSCGTHLVKNHESQSRTNETQLKKKSEIENAWDVCNQTVNLKTLYYSILKL